MKKFIAIILSLVMVLSVFAGCSAEESAGDGKYKVGVILYGKEDTLGGRIYSLLNDAAKALDCEITFALGDFDPTTQLTSAENLIAAGCDGIIVLPLSEIASQKIGQLCKEREVYFGLLLRTITDPDIDAEVRANPYFVGNILGDDMGNAKELTRILIEEYGCKNLCTYYVAEGSSLAQRNEGIRTALGEYGGVQLSEATCPSDSNMAPVAGVTQNFVNTNKDLQGIISAAGSSGIGETICSTLQTMSAQGVKYACFDTFDGMVDAFNSGYLSVVCGGQAPACIYLFSMLYNAMDGHKLTETGKELRMTYIFIRSAQEAENFLNYIDNPEVAIYSAEEIKNMTVRYNASFNWDALQQVMDDYTYDNIMAKLS